jgi:hypothetical protein
MNKVMTFAILATSILVWEVGCDSRSSIAHNPPTLTKEGFPEVMVGVWEVQTGRNSKWGIKFEQDGSMKRIIHAVAGPVVLNDGSVYSEGPEKGTYYLFVMGPCTASYESATEMVKVQIIVDYFRMQFVDDALEGRMTDYIEGPVSKDGKTWETKWRCYSWLEGATPPDANIIEANPDTLIFKKIKID